MTTDAIALPHFWNLLDALPVAILYKEHARSRILANKAALLLFQLPPEQPLLSLKDLQQLPLYGPDRKGRYDLLHNPLLLALSGSELEQTVILQQNQLLLSSKMVSLSYTLHSSVLISLQPASVLAPAPQMSAVAVHADIAELEEALAFDKLISLISTELINVQDDKLDQHIEDALAAVGEFCHADRSYVFQFNDEINEMSNTHEWVRDGITSAKAQLQQIPQQALPYFYEKIQQDLVFAVDKVAELPAEASAEKQEFDAEDIQSVLCCAMLADDKLIGFVGCDMVSRQRHWINNDLRRLKLVGEMLANTLQNVRYRHSLQAIQLQLQQANAQLQQQANQDGLTGIANRRHFDTTLQQELQRCSRYHLPLGLLMLDIDYFKAYNDYYGHQKGDTVLQQVSRLLQQQIKREGELAARYGGEEFAIILPAADANACNHIASGIQQQLQKLAIPHQGSDIKPILTLSIGYCSIMPDKNSSASELIQRADAALYRAKNTGRNAIVASSTADITSSLITD